ncbi:MAG: purine-nucleoside phosphorylase, partial [Verrucomicrobiales bacterium]|nr:purine-nucleoside phosphorylase [Verrucomicrobiales bacterium]
LNLARQSPLTGSAQFVDQTEVYSKPLRELLRAESLELSGVRLPEGIYAWVNGPEYETPAEIWMLRTLGADAVGMSTVPEAIQARALGMRVVALSCLTNYGAGLSAHPLSHEEVMAVGQKAAGELYVLLESAIPAMVEI